MGAAAPDFVLPGLSGGDVALADFAGKPVVVNFWASWCHPCRKEFPLLKAARAKHARDGLEVIGVSYRDIASDGRAFVADQGADWAFARDPDGKLAAAYGVRAVPQTFFVDADGTIVSRVFGITSAAGPGVRDPEDPPRRPLIEPFWRGFAPQQGHQTTPKGWAALTPPSGRSGRRGGGRRWPRG